jgi:bacterioferritin (cytochrome b1)
MIEPFVPLVVAAATGFAVLTSKIYNRIAILDSKVDKIELRVVQDYVTKGDFNNALTRMEGHLIRMEDKLDAIAQTKCK